MMDTIFDNIAEFYAGNYNLKDSILNQLNKKYNEVLNESNDKQELEDLQTIMEDINSTYQKEHEESLMRDLDSFFTGALDYEARTTLRESLLNRLTEAYQRESNVVDNELMLKDISEVIHSINTTYTLYQQMYDYEKNINK